MQAIKILPETNQDNGWLKIARPHRTFPVLRKELSVDIVVIGAGFVGLAAARRLAELNPSTRIAILEALQVGDNAAGRSSGFAIDHAHNIRAKSFAEEAEKERRQIRLNRAGQSYLREIVTSKGIACDWRDEGKIHGAGTSRGASLLESFKRNLGLLKEEYEDYDAARMHGITGTDFYFNGLFTPGTTLVQPAELVIGLAETLPENVSIFDRSPVVGIELGSPHQLKTPDGHVFAKQLVFANNGFGSAFGLFSDRLIPISTFGSMTRRLTDAEIVCLGGRASWGIIPANPFGTTVRRIADNRILVRNTYSYSSRINPTRSQLSSTARSHKRSFENRFPMLTDVSFEYSWGGPLTLSGNNQPVFGAVGNNAYAAICDNGVGICRGTIHGKLLAEEMSNHDSELLRIVKEFEGPSKIPPKPFLGWGVGFNLAYRRFRAGREL